MGETQLKALVVDDNEVNTLVLATMLELFGIHVDQIYTGEGAVLMFYKNDYDLVFIDHIMPEMDGVQTTEKLRSLVKDKDRTAIFALTSNLTEDIKCIYQGIGANDVFAKPLGLEEVILILKKWFPQLPIEEASYMVKSSEMYSEEEDLIKFLLKDIPEINYEEGLKYAIGNPIHYAHILKVSIKDIKSSIDLIIQNQEQESLEDMRIGMHNLKSLFSNIGAIELFEITRFMYRLSRLGEYNKMKLHLSEYIIKICSFNDLLENAINQYTTIELLAANKQEKEECTMSELEYEQCLSNTIYYIKRFEYDLIMKELSKLIPSSPPNLKKEFMKAFEEVREFNYDNALARIMKITKKEDR